MQVPFLDLKAQYATIREEVRSAVDDVLASQKFVLGAQVGAFEEEVARLCRVPYAVGLASGTDALLLALKSLGIGNGDAVVTVPYTFFATAGAVANLGARPLFVDIEESSFNMDPSRLADLLDSECSFSLKSRRLVHKASAATVRAVVPVHLYGQCAEMDDILEICRRYGLPVVEDACQAIGARYRDEYAGAMGDIGCFSFFPSKNLGGAGDGGMVITRNRDLAQKVRLLRGHGAQPKYFHSIVGYNSRLDEIQAAILRVKLRYLSGWTAARQSNASSYSRKFAEAATAALIQVPATLPHRTHIFHQYVIRCLKRDELRTALQSRDIGTEIYYPLSLHEQECFRELGYRASDFPCSRSAAQQTLALPIYPELTGAQMDYVVASIVDFYRQNPLL